MNILRKSRYHLYPIGFNFNCNCYSLISNLSYYSAISSSGFLLFHHNFSSLLSKCNLSFNFSNGWHSIFQFCAICNGSDSRRNDFQLYSASVCIHNTYVRRFTQCAYANNVAAADSTVIHRNDSVNGKVAAVGSTMIHKIDSGSNKVAAVGSTAIRKISSGCSNNIYAKKGRNFNEHEVSPIVITNIVEIVKNDADDMEHMLDLIGSNLSKSVIIEVFSVLNRLKVSALRFFDWTRSAHSKYSRNADLCSLAIDNCGRLGDFNALRILLNDFGARKITLSDKAFGFLNISGATSEEAKKSIAEILGLLNEVGGSCRNSGILSLITMLCSLNLVDLAKFVLEITEIKPCHYNILVKHMCVKGQLKGAQDMLLEWSRLGCYTDATAYNYVISSLCVQGRIDEACSIPNEMIDRGCLPGHLTYEILIYFTCRYGRSDDAMNLYNEMLSRGIKPRLPTYSAFIRGYVSAQHFDEAYRYVVDAITKDKWSASHMYNVLTSLHIEHGDLLVAHKLILEMVEKGMNPKPSVCRRASNCLRKTGRSELAKILDTRCYAG